MTKYRHFVQSLFLCFPLFWNMAVGILNSNWRHQKKIQSALSNAKIVWKSTSAFPGLYLLTKFHGTKFYNTAHSKAIHRVKFRPVKGNGDISGISWRGLLLFVASDVLTVADTFSVRGNMINSLFAHKLDVFNIKKEKRNRPIPKKKKKLAHSRKNRYRYVLLSKDMFPQPNLYNFI